MSNWTRFYHVGTLQQAARKVAVYGGRMALVAHVADEIGMPREQLRAAVDAMYRQGLVDLAKADMPQIIDRRDFADSVVNDEQRGPLVYLKLS